MAELVRGSGFRAHLAQVAVRHFGAEVAIELVAAEKSPRQTAVVARAPAAAQETEAAILRLRVAHRGADIRPAQGRRRRWREGGLRLHAAHRDAPPECPPRCFPVWLRL